MGNVRLVLALTALSIVGCGGPSNPNDGGNDTGTDAVTNNDGQVGTDGGDGGSSNAFACSTGTLFAGNPLDTNPMARPTEGTGLLQGAPFPYRNIVFSNGQMITHDGQEIWRANLSDGLLHKLAGTESTQQALVTGPCASARFGNIFGIALGHDGSLYVSDQTANTILKITDPLGPSCMVSHYAGTPTDQAEGTFNPDTPPNVGNVEGPGATAKFALPERLAIDSNDNLYVWDAGNNSIRRIGSDAAHTVSTIAPGISTDAGGSLFQVVLNGKLYVWGKFSNDVFLSEIDLTTMAKRDLFRGRADLFGGDSSDSQSWGGMVTDGTGLIVTFNGQLFYVETNGHIRMPALAGTYHPGLDYSSGYDPMMPHPAAMLEIPERSQSSTAGAYSWLAIDAMHNLYVSALVTNAYVLKISCAP